MRVLTITALFILSLLSLNSHGESIKNPLFTNNYNKASLEDTNSQKYDHLEYIFSSAKELTCKSSLVTIKICTTSNFPCNNKELATYPVELKPILTNDCAECRKPSILGSSPLVVTGTSDIHIRQNNTITGSTHVRLGLETSIPAAANKPRCLLGEKEIDCTITFNDSEFLFYSDEATTNQWGNNLSNNASSLDTDYLISMQNKNIYLKALQNDGFGNCTSKFNNIKKSIDISFNYSDPSIPRIAEKLTIGNANLNPNTSNMLNLYFNANGVAKLPISYQEAGKIKLTAKYKSSSNTNSLNNSFIKGETSLVAIPAGFCMELKSSLDTTSATGHQIKIPTSDHVACNDINCFLFHKVTGKNVEDGFNLILYPVAGSNPIMCKNKKLENFVPNDLFTMSLRHPSSTYQDTLYDNFTMPTLTSNLGSNIGETKFKFEDKPIKFAINDIGIFTFDVNKDKNHKYMGVNLPYFASSKPVRFAPYYFSVNTMSDIRTSYYQLDKTCENKLYMDQPIISNIIINAKTKDEHQTKNYNGAFAKAEVSLVATDNKNNLSDRLSFYKNNNKINNLNFLDGLINNGYGTFNVITNYYSDLKLQFKRHARLDGPYEAKFGVSVNDNEAAVIDNGEPYHITTLQHFVGDGINKTGIRFAQQIENKTFSIKYGRIALEGVYGKVGETLSMPLRAQYWNSSTNTWLINIDDNCTILNQHRLSEEDSLKLKIDLSKNKLHNGVTTAYWTPLTNNTMSIKTNFSLESTPWLRYRWTKTRLDPSTFAYWGLYGKLVITPWLEN